MSLTSKEAAETLSDVARAERRSAQAFGYSKASPHLILWGAIWIVGYAATDLYPSESNWIWLALVLSGCAGAFVIGRLGATPGRKREADRRSWQACGAMAIVTIFMFATYAIMWPVRGMGFAAFPSLLVGAIYAAVGLWFGLRYLVTGLLISALTLIGYFYLSEHFLLWMAFVGGGALILAGFWFRRA